MKLLIILISLLPVSLLAQLSKQNQAYVEPSGFLTNPNFIERLGGWTNTGGCVPSYSQDGEGLPRTLTLTCSSKTLSFKQCSKSFSTFTPYVDAYAHINASGDKKIFFSVEDGDGHEIYSHEVNQGYWQQVSFPFVTRAQSCINVKSESGFTGTVKLSSVNIKENKGLTSFGTWNNETQATSLSTASALTETTNLNSLTHTKDEGSGFYTLSSAGITMLKDASVVIALGMQLSGSGTEISGDIRLNGDLVSTSRLTRESGSQDYSGGTATFASKVKSGDKITFTSAAVGTSQIHILATSTSRTMTQMTDFNDLKNHAVFSAKINSDGTIADQGGVEWIASSSRPSTGIYEINYKSGLFDSVPHCVSQLFNGTGVGRYDGTSTKTKGVWDIRNLSGALANSQVEILCKKTGDDYKNAFRSFMIGELKQENVKMREQFPTTEIKLCDDCYKGKALYRKCWTGTAHNSSIVSGVSELVKATGSCVNSGGTYIPVPVSWDGSSSCEPVLWSSGTIVTNKNGAFSSTTAHLCVEYTKD